MGGMNRSSAKLDARQPDAILTFPLPGQSFKLAVFSDDGALTGIDFLTEEQITQAPRSALAEKVALQLQAYLDDPQRPFDLPLNLQGTQFQRRLWSALQNVPAGETATYGELVKKLGMRGGAQAVGQACRRNPIPIIVPCHRILSRSGVGGYAGRTSGEKLALKQSLLLHEGVVCG